MAGTNRTLKVFLCHAHSDKDAVKALYDRLVEDGVDAWLDKEKLLPGQNWRTEIQKAVRGADVVVVCHSKEFNQTGFRQREVRWALDTAREQPQEAIFIIPARLEECDVLESLREWQWVNLYEDNGYERLMRSLQTRANNIGATLQSRQGVKEESPVPVVKEEAPEQVKKQDVPVESVTPKPKVSDKPKRRSSKLKTEYVVAIIGAAATIIAAIIGSPLIERIFSQVPEPIATATRQIQLVLTETPKVAIETDTPSPIQPSTKTVTTSPTAPPAEITDVKGVEMVLVPEGEFTMGSDSGSDNERPAHQVYINTFYIDKYEVTNAQYKVCVEAKICDPLKNTNDYNNPLYAQHPVVNVDWNMAKKYCKWRVAGLPSEAEWEKAARGTDGRVYPWDKEGIDGTFANYNQNVGDTTPVGSYPKGVSPYGAYDMIGNVWEWVEDWYKAYPGNTINSDEYGTTYRVLRGGSWYLSIGDLHSAIRFRNGPTTTTDYFGFRCARDIPAEDSP